MKSLEKKLTGINLLIKFRSFNIIIRYLKKFIKRKIILRLFKIRKIKFIRRIEIKVNRDKWT